MPLNKFTRSEAAWERLCAAILAALALLAWTLSFFFHSSTLDHIFLAALLVLLLVNLAVFLVVGHDANEGDD